MIQDRASCSYEYNAVHLRHCSDLMLFYQQIGSACECTLYSYGQGVSSYTAAALMHMASSYLQ